MIFGTAIIGSMVEVITSNSTARIMIILAAIFFIVIGAINYEKK